MNQNFRTLQLAKSLYQQCTGLAIKGEIRDQLERASLSIYLNLAEGSGRTGKDRVRFFRMAYGSLKEVCGCLDVLKHSLVGDADRLGGSILV